MSRTDVRPERVGVMFVHGSGRQAQSSTLRAWAEPLIAWLTLWHSDADRRAGLGDERVRISVSRLSYGNDLAPGEPAHLRIAIPAYADAAGPRRRAWGAAEWVLAEGWSASRIDAPELGRIALWSARIYLRVLLRLISAISRRVAERIQARVPDTLRLRVGDAVHRGTQDLERKGAREWLDRIGLVVLAVGYALAAAVGYVFLVLPLALIAQVPIGLVRELALVNGLRRFLLESIGDFYTYLYDEIQALHIRHAILRTIGWLDEQGCDRICVVAHSHGAVVAYDALTQTDRAPRPAEGVAKVTKLITLGEALNNAIDLRPEGLSRLDFASRGLGAGVRWVDLWSIFDPVPGAAVTIPGGISVEVTNRMDVLVDHHVYLENEQVLSRLVQEIDAPAAPDGSRFRLGDAAARDQARIDRVGTLFIWRLAGMGIVAAAVAGRAIVGGVDAIARDGSAILGLAGRIPVVGEIAELIASVPWTERAVALFLALLAYLALYQVAYLIALQLWRRWDDRARAAAARVAYRPAGVRERLWVGLATAAALLAYLDAAVLILGRS